jgi:hypothetical protein
MLQAAKYNVALWLGFIAMGLALVSYYLIGRAETLYALNILVLSVSVVVNITWFPAAIGAIRNGARSAADKIVLTVWGSWMILTVQRIYTLLLTVYERPSWLIETPINILIVTGIIVAGRYAAYSTIGEAEAPRQEKLWVYFGTAAGGCVFGILVTWSLLGAKIF